MPVTTKVGRVRDSISRNSVIRNIIGSTSGVTLKPASRGHLKTGQLMALIQDKNSFYLASSISGK